MAPFAALEVNRLLEKGKTTSCLADLISLKADFQVNPKSHDWHFYFFTKGIRVFYVGHKELTTKVFRSAP